VTQLHSLLVSPSLTCKLIMPPSVVAATNNCIIDSCLLLVPEVTYDVSSGTLSFLALTLGSLFDGLLPHSGALRSMEGEIS